MSVVRRDVARGLPASLLSVVIVVVSIVPAVLGGVPVDGLTSQLVAGAVLFALVSPIQDHLRGLLHVVGLHWRAASMSGVTLALTVTIVVVARSHEWLGLSLFGALAAGNLCSLFAGSWFLKRTSRVELITLPRLAVRSRYLVADVVVQVAGYIASTLVVALLGSAALADLEAARIAAAPVFVIVSGLAAVLVPAMVRAVVGPRGLLIRRSVKTVIGVLSLGAAYSAFTILVVPLLSLATGRHIPAQLASWRAASASVEGAGNTLAAPLYAQGRSWSWILISVASSGISLATMPTLLVSQGAFGLPMAQLIGGASRLGMGLVALARRG